MKILTELERCVASTNELDPKYRYALPYEVLRLSSQLQGVDEGLAALAPEVEAAMSHSSETWHDNPQADAVFEEMNKLDLLKSGLVKASKKLVGVPYPTSDVTHATIGSRVLCKIGDEQFHLDITGNAPLGTEANDNPNVDRGSFDAPVPGGIIGVVMGATVDIDMSGRRLEVSVLEIDQNAQRYEYGITL